MNHDIPDGFKMTEIGVIPDDWDIMRLGDITKRTGYKDPSIIPEQTFKYIDVSSISRESLKVSGYSIYKGNDAPSRARKLINSHDVIIATVRPTLKRIALIDREFDGDICSTAFCVLRAKDEIILPEYIYYSIQRDIFIDALGRIQRGVSYPAVTDSNVKEQFIPIPPLHEQRAIASILSAIQSAKEKTDAVIQATRALKKSLMKYLFTYGPVPVEEAEDVPLKKTEVGMIPEDWNVKQLVDIATLQRGKDLPRQHQVPGQYPVVGSSGIIAYHNEYVCEGPGIVTGRSGSIGKFTYIEGRHWPHNTGLYVKNFHNNVPRFIYYLLHKLDFNRYATGVSVPTLNRNFIHVALLPVPPLPIQQQIADILSAVDYKIEAEENRSKALDELFKTLLHNLMTGKIRVNSMEI